MEHLPSDGDISKGWLALLPRAESQPAGNPHPEDFCPSTCKELFAKGWKDATNSKLAQNITAQKHRKKSIWVYYTQKQNAPSHTVLEIRGIFIEGVSVQSCIDPVFCLKFPLLSITES